MEAIRRYVFPLVWMVLVGAVAVALLKLAFFSAPREATDSTTPTASFDTATTVQVEKGDVTADLNLQAKVTADAATPVAASAAGVVVKVWADAGDEVERGEALLQVRSEDDSPAPAAGPTTAAAPKNGATPNGAATSAPTAAVRYTYRTVRAPSAGTVRSLTAKRGASVEAGATVASVSPGTYSAIAALTPEQHLRVLDHRLDVTATLPSSPEPVSCRNPRIDEDDTTGGSPGGGTTADAAAAPDDSMGTGEDPSGTTSSAQLRCPMPVGTKIVSGLAVDLVVGLGSAHEVLVVPATAVQGSGTSGAVYMPGPAGGEPVRRAVTLGLRSDDTVQITKGLRAGEKVLQFAPGVDDPSGGQGGDMPAEAP